jgi:hypothetical protein
MNPGSSATSCVDPKDLVVGGQRPTVSGLHDAVALHADRRSAVQFSGVEIEQGRTLDDQVHLSSQPGDCPRQNVYVEFAIRYDRWFRALATVIGLGPKQTAIRVDDDTLHVRYGWAFRLDVPRKDIKSARLIAERPMAWGVHTTGEYWYVNGSRDGIVELKLSRPATSNSVKFQAGDWGEVHRLYLSLEDPDGFIAALKSHPTD